MPQTNGTGLDTQSHQVWQYCFSFQIYSTYFRVPLCSCSQPTVDTRISEACTSADPKLYFPTPAASQTNLLLFQQILFMKSHSHCPMHLNLPCWALEHFQGPIPTWPLNSKCFLCPIRNVLVLSDFEFGKLLMYLEYPALAQKVFPPLRLVSCFSCFQMASSEM